MPTTKLPDTRIHYLDGLRGLLAIAVFLHHFFYIFCPDVIFGGTANQFLTHQWSISAWLAFTPLNIIFNPGTAINFFFLLSGYAQSYHYFQKPDITFLQRSFIKRYFRLAVPTLSVVLLVFVSHRLHLINKGYIPGNALTNGWIKSMMPDSLNLWDAIQYGAAQCFEGNSGYYQVLWSMSPEIYNSWMVLILLLLTYNIKNSIPLLLLWLLVQLTVLHGYYSVSFILGVLVCQLQAQSAQFKTIFSKPLVKWALALVGLYFASYPFTGYVGSTEYTIYKPVSFFDNGPHALSYIFGNLLLFTLLLHSKTMKKILSKKLFLFFGDISFMLYLVHFLVLFSFSAWLYHRLVPHFVLTANLWLTALSSFAIIVLVSYVLTKLIDKPTVKYCNRFTKKLFGV